MADGGKRQRRLDAGQIRRPFLRSAWSPRTKSNTGSPSTPSTTTALMVWRNVQFEKLDQVGNGFHARRGSPAPAGASGRGAWPGATARPVRYWRRRARSGSRRSRLRRCRPAPGIHGCRCRQSGRYRPPPGGKLRPRRVKPGCRRRTCPIGGFQAVKIGVEGIRILHVNSRARITPKAQSRNLVCT